MATASSIKASEKQVVCKKLTTTLKKRYGGSVPKVEYPVLESLLFAICLENETYERATELYDQVFEQFHDLNEMRVSSIGELEAAFAGAEDADWRALRLRSALQYIFEKNYVYEFDAVKKKTLDLAARQLSKIPHLSPFVLNWVMQNSIGAHLIPLDDAMRNAAVWLGLLERAQTDADGAEALKAAVRKSDTPLFGYLLKCLSVDPPVRALIQDDLKATDEEFDPLTAPNRLSELLADADAGKRRGAKKKPAAKGKAKSAEKKSSASKPKAAARKTASKTSRAKPARKK